MSNMGQQLRQARMEKGYSLEDIQTMTKIQKRYLQAIEEQEFKVLPGTFYVKAFIKSYAEAVGLDPNELLAQYQIDLPTPPYEQPAEIMLGKRKKRNYSAPGSKWTATFLMWSFAILVGGVIYWCIVNYGQSTREAVDTKTNINQANVIPPEETVPKNEAIASNTDLVNPEKTDVSGTEREQNANVEIPPQPVEGTVTIVQSGKQGSVPIWKIQTTAPNAKVEVVFEAAEKSTWLSVREQNRAGKRLFNENLKLDEPFKVELTNSVYVYMKQWEAVKIKVNGSLLEDTRAGNPKALLIEKENTNVEANEPLENNSGV